MREVDALIIGGGSAGLAAALEIKHNGIDNILIIERDQSLGGILNQCIHNGFGLKVFKEELTGPEYAEKYVNQVKEAGISYVLNAMVIKIHPGKVVEYASHEDGFVKIKAKAIVITTGCYERSAGAISIPGDRPSGVFTAGTAQKYLNMDGYLVGKNVFILGSGDIGLIMARRMTLEGANVLGVAEIMPYSGGLNRNIVQCLDDYDIPLYLSHTVTKIIGEEHIEQIVVQKVDGFTPVPGTEMTFDVDALLLSIGLIPENGIAEDAGIHLHPKTKGPIVDEQYQTNVNGIFACGNALHVHDLVDYVTEESIRAGKAVSKFLLSNKKEPNKVLKTIPLSGINYIVPQHVNPDNLGKTLELFMRVDGIYQNKKLCVKAGSKTIREIKRKHLAPAEMEKVILPARMLANVTDDITIEVVAA